MIPKTAFTQFLNRKIENFSKSLGPDFQNLSYGTANWPSQARLTFYLLIEKLFFLSNLIFQMRPDGINQGINVTRSNRYQNFGRNGFEQF